MDAVDVLMEARAYVDKGWTQGASARNATGQTALFWSEEAAEWCVTGAIAKGTPTPFGLDEDDPNSPFVPFNSLLFAARDLFARAACLPDGWTILDWNDHKDRTKENVLETFDRAISLGLREAGDR